MKKVKSWYLPDNEHHFEREMTSKNVDGYQVPSRKATLKKIKKLPGFIPLLALDVGANVGFWTRDLARIFKKVNAYEPLPENIECLINNVPDKNVFVKKFALGDKTEVKELMIPQNGNCGSATFQDSNIVDNCEVNRLDVLVKTLDNELASETTEMLQNCFIKIDTQGHENEVLKGAETFVVSSSGGAVFSGIDVTIKEGTGIAHDKILVGTENQIESGVALYSHQITISQASSRDCNFPIS